MKLFSKLVIVFLLVFNGAHANSQDYKFHSIFMYNFTKYIEWPDSYKSGDFVIGVLGDSPIVEHLKNMAQVKSVGAQKFTIKVFSSAADVSQCHILFIPEFNSGLLKDVRTKLKGSATLLITEQDGLATQGSAINFIIKEGKWKFELNKQVAESANLKISSELSRLAILV